MPLIATYIVPHPPIIIPDIGKGEEQKVQNTLNAYRQIAKEIKDLMPDTIIISSPHALTYGDYFHVSPIKTMMGDFTQFGVGDLECYPTCDTKLVNAIEKKAKSSGFPMGTQGSKNYKLDHGVCVPLYFINREYDNYKLVVVSPSALSSTAHYHAGKIIHSAIPREKRVVWIASGDLSHKLKEDGPYGYEPQGPLFDKEITTSLSEGDFLKLLEFKPKYCHKVAECGVGSFTMMAGALDGYDIKSELLSYEGPFGVGYAIIKYTDLEFSTSRHFDVMYKSILDDSIKDMRSKEDEYIKLARESLEYFIRNRKKLPLNKDIDDELLNTKAGVFVSIHLNNRLRGCIGTIKSTKKNTAEEIIDNAISAGTRDYRFPKIKESELELLEYKVDVLLPPEYIKSEDELDIKKYGVIVSSGYKKGLLLPNIEGVHSIDEQVSIAKQKARIEDYEEVTLQRFEVIRHE